MLKHINMPVSGNKFLNPQSVISVLDRFCSIVKQMCRHFIEGVAGYGEMEWRRRCRQADETGKEA
ncbi:hypothetical protein JCM15124A_14440 [Prevotella falsenii]|uniref:hypothetical protein n=1 Tax=Prevotella falsenii TaxID=515414 RepID=UPI000469AC87|nr:hypothetical protein [Prevotella falsenii]